MWKNETAVLLWKSEEEMLFSVCLICTQYTDYRLQTLPSGTSHASIRS